MDPNFGFAHLWPAHVYEPKGMFDQATAELKTGMLLSEDSPYALDKLGYGYAVARMRQEAQGVLNQLQTLSEQKYVSPFDVAMVHVGLQEKDELSDGWIQPMNDGLSGWAILVWSRNWTPCAPTLASRNCRAEWLE